MKKIYSTILLSLSAIFFTACGNDQNIPYDGFAFEGYYFLEAYFIPQDLLITETFHADGNHYSIDFNHKEKVVSEKSNPTLFLQMAKEHGETGEKIIYSASPFPFKPYDIAGLKVYAQEQNTKTDVSEDYSITFENYFPYISSNYTRRDKGFTGKILTELTEYDIYWLPSKIALHANVSDTRPHYFVLILKDGTKITQELKK